jgi:hypothetical protein
MQILSYVSFSDSSQTLEAIILEKFKQISTVFKRMTKVISIKIRFYQKDIRLKTF